MIVYLTPAEEAHVAAAARAVNDHKDAVGKPNVGWTRGGVEADPLQQRTDAFRAEYALAKLLGLDPLEWAIHDGGDGQIDLVLPSPCVLGRTIQVKHRSERNRDLATSSLDFHKELKADLYVLAWPAFNDGIEFAGWCFRDDWLLRISDWSRPPVRFLGLRYEMRWHDDLRPMAQLVEEVTHARHAATGGDLRQDEERQGHAGDGAAGALAHAGAD